MALLAIASGASMHIWDYQTSETTRFEPHGSTPITSLAWNHNGQVIASCASRDSENEPTVSLTSISSDSSTEQFSHDLHLRRPTLPTQPPIPTTVAFGGKSRYVLSGDDSGAVCLWDLKKKARVRHFFHDEPTIQVAMTDAEVISLSQSALRIFDLKQSTLRHEIYGGKFTCFAISKDMIALGRFDGSISIVDWKHPESMHTPSTSKTSRITDLVFSPANPNLLAASTQDGQLIFLDIATGQTIQAINVKEEITSLSFVADGIHFALGIEPGRVLIYDLRTPDQVIAFKDFGAPIKTLEFAPRGYVSKPSSNGATVVESNIILGLGEEQSKIATPKIRHIPVEPQRGEENAAFNRTTTEEVVNNALDQLRDEMESSVRNLHVEMLRQFQIQSDEFAHILSTQMNAMAQIMAENEKLRDEIAILRK